MPKRPAAARRASVATCLVVILGISHLTPAATAAAELPLAPEPYVVAATLDTGTNPFHPTWRRDRTEHPSTYIPGYPPAAPSLDLTFSDTFEDSVEASLGELAKLPGTPGPYWVPGTNIIGTWWTPEDDIPLFEANPPSFASHDHGARASSQIAGTGLGLAEDAYLVVVDTQVPGLITEPYESYYRANADGLRWAADQSWIDIIHTNIQNPVPLAGKHPVLDGYYEAVEYAIGKGKLVVSAGGNFYALPTETSPHTGPSGVLVAGANDNCGATAFSNPNPHVVMDGATTVAAQSMGFGLTVFGGTSSASPLTTGYVAQLLLELRRAVGDRHGFRDGALIVLDDVAARPTSGPLADGRLEAAELHEVIRKTANPNAHASRFDGETDVTECVPLPGDLPAAVYPKMGYGEISEHTLPTAVDVTLGRAPLPARPVEDAAYATSEAVRAALWE